MTTLDEARKWATFLARLVERMRGPKLFEEKSLGVIRDLIAMVEAPVTDAEVEVACRTFFGYRLWGDADRSHMRAALEAAAAAWS